MIIADNTKSSGIAIYDRSGRIGLRLSTAMGPPTKTAAALLEVREESGALASGSGEGLPSPSPFPDPALVVAVADAVRNALYEEGSKSL